MSIQLPAFLTQSFRSATEQGKEPSQTPRIKAVQLRCLSQTFQSIDEQIIKASQEIRKIKRMNLISNISTLVLLTSTVMTIALCIFNLSFLPLLFAMGTGALAVFAFKLRGNVKFYTPIVKLKPVVDFFKEINTEIQELSADELTFEKLDVFCKKTEEKLKDKQLSIYKNSTETKEVTDHLAEKDLNFSKKLQIDTKNKLEPLFLALKNISQTRETWETFLIKGQEPGEKFSKKITTQMVSTVKTSIAGFNLLLPLVLVGIKTNNDNIFLGIAEFKSRGK